MTPLLFLAQIAENAAEEIGFYEKLKIIFPTFGDALIFAGLILCGLAVGKIVRRGIVAILRKLKSKFAKKATMTLTVAEAAIRALPAALVCAGIFIGRELRFPEITAAEKPAVALLDQAIQIVAVIALTQILWSLVRVPTEILRRYAARGNRAFALGTLIPLIGAALHCLVALWGVLLVLRVATDTRPAEILAMLGIGGLAISLAAQDSVKNFFGTAMLVVDRPFSVGDIIDLGAGTQGVVAKIGLRSTRIRTPEDHEICIPNADLANRTITKISAREKIRRTLDLGLTYSTPPEKIEEAIAIISSVLNDSGKLAKGTTASVLFNEFTDSALNIRVIYSFYRPSVAEAGEFAQAVNLEILRKFNAAGISFAFPTRTVELKNVP